MQTLVLMTVALAVVMLAGLAIVPALEEAQAANPTSESRDKGQQGEIKSKGKRTGAGSGGIDT